MKDKHVLEIGDKLIVINEDDYGSLSAHAYKPFPIAKLSKKELAELSKVIAHLVITQGQN